MNDKYIKTEKYELYNYDNIEIMDLLIAQGIKVDLTVTSPPYDDLRSYNGTLEWNFEIFKKVAHRLYDITKEGVTYGIKNYSVRRQRISKKNQRRT